MHTDILREPVELINEDLDVIAGGNGLNISVDVNVAVINQLIEQIQVFSSGVTASALANANVTQTT